MDQQVIHDKKLIIIKTKLILIQKHIQILNQRI